VDSQQLGEELGGVARDVERGNTGDQREASGSADDLVVVRAGKQAKQAAIELGIHPVTLSKWLRQDDIDNERRPGTPSSESAELRAARRRIRELETELGIVRQAAKFLGEDKPRPKGSTR
jgi:transposase-like protein